MAGGEQGNERHEAAQRQDAVVSLRDEGLTFREIASELGICHQRAWQLYQRALRDRPVIAEHEQRKAQRHAEQLERIDMEREVALGIVSKGKRTVVTPAGKVVEDVEDDATVLAAIDRLQHLDDQEAKLLGLYAEQKFTGDVRVNYTVSGVDPGSLT